MRPLQMSRYRAGASRAPARIRAVLTLLAAGMVGGCATVPPRPTYARYEVFCYRTLADVGCFPRPEDGAAARFTGLAWSGPVRLLTLASGRRRAERLSRRGQAWHPAFRASKVGGKERRRRYGSPGEVGE